LSRAYPKVTLLSSGLWHIKLHQGLIDSFKSTIRYGPIFGRQEAYNLLGQRQSKTLVMGGTIDPIIIADQLKEDIVAAMGDDKVEWRLIEGAHNIPYTNSKEIVDIISKFWGNGSA
jgi:hypothetical protein